MIRPSSRHESSRGVHYYHITVCGFLPIQNLTNDRGIYCRVSARDVIQCGAAHTELFRSHFVGSYHAVASFRNTRWSGDRNLVQSVETMHDQSAVEAQHAK